MEQKFQLAKNYNYIQDMQQEAYIDVKDTVNHWCVGIIIDTDEEKNLVKIHFEGWTNRYDEVNILFFTNHSHVVVKKDFIKISSF